MNLILKFRERVSVLSYALVQELEQLLGVIRQTFRAEHNDDGSHTAVTADSVTSDTLTGTTSLTARSTTAASGYVHLRTGSASNVGYVAWYKPGPTRIGYLGFNAGAYGGSDNLALVLENSADLVLIAGSLGINKDPSYALDVTGEINATTGFRANGTAGYSGAVTVRNAAGTGTTTLTFVGGILTTVV